MKIGRIRSSWIVFTLITATINTCLRIVTRYYFLKSKRQDFDNILTRWINKLINRAKIKCSVHNPHNTQPQPGQAVMLMCNHTSVYDIPLAFKAFPNHSIRMLAKKELSKFPLLGKAMAAAEFPFVDRKNRYQAVKDLEYAKKLMESGILLWVAPEGTRSNTGKLAPFKKGGFVSAIEVKATIIPIGIRGAFDIAPPNSMKLNLNQKAEIHIGKPIDASQFTLENRDLLIQQTYDAIKELLGEE